jgi:hypothetical protein
MADRTKLDAAIAAYKADPTPENKRAVELEGERYMHDQISEAAADEEEAE